LVDRPPAPGEAPTCAAEGVFPPLLAVANALQLDAANRYLAGRITTRDDVLYSLTLRGAAQTRLGPRETARPATVYNYLEGALDHFRPPRGGVHPATAPLRLQTIEAQLAASSSQTAEQPFRLLAETEDKYAILRTACSSLAAETRSICTGSRRSTWAPDQPGVAAAVN
jgi:hypothetical protein